MAKYYGKIGFCVTAESAPGVWAEDEIEERNSELFMELASDAKMAAEFINGVLPKEAADAIGVETTDVNS